jgi:hypothetical protein
MVMQQTGGAWQRLRASRFGRLGGVLAILVVGGALLLPASHVAANVRVAGGDTLPFYARISSGEVFHTDDWAVVVFYRPPACVPADFNLLAFFDVPRAFGCTPPTVDGFSIWAHGPGIDPAPIQGQFHGLGAVPVWFVRWPELQATIADGVLTIGELAALPSRVIGSAGFYQETLHPEQAAQNGKIAFVARGTLADGRSFQVQAALSRAAGRLTHMRIVFR